MRGRIVLGLGVLVAVLAVAGGRESTEAASAPSCTLSWSVVPSKPLAGGGLSAVSALASDDAWAVGGASSWSRTQRPPALTEHWDGTRWTTVASPRVAGVLEDVAAVDHADVWAVGELGGSTSRTGFGPGRGALAERWDGERWKRMSVPGARRLSAVAATSGDDVWTVGSDAAGAAIVLHWTGSHWTRALRRPESELFDIVAISPTDVWAVGDVTSRRFLELHWDGKHWSSYIQPPPNGGYGPDEEPELAAVAASGSRDVWAAGDAASSGDGPGWADTVILHWNGTRWRDAPSTLMTWVDALATRAPGDVLLAGLAGDDDGYVQGGAGPAIQRWQNNRWQTTTLVNGERIVGLAANTSGGLWAVGFRGTGIDANNGFPLRSHR
jgi:hypothetical protein